VSIIKKAFAEEDESCEAYFLCTANESCEGEANSSSFIELISKSSPIIGSFRCFATSLNSTAYLSSATAPLLTISFGLNLLMIFKKLSILFGSSATIAMITFSPTLTILPL